MTLASTAHHEAGHAVATVHAFRKAAWLPHPMPPMPVRYVEIAGDGGHCAAFNIYSVRWSEDRIAPHYRPLMESQVMIHLAGGVAEAIHCGYRRADEAWAYAVDHCRIDTDRRGARVVLDDLSRLTGRRHDEQPFAARAMTLLATPRPAYEAVIDRRRWTISFGAIAPAAAALEHMHNPADHAAIIDALDTTHIHRQMRLYPRPLLVA